MNKHRFYDLIRGIFTLIDIVRVFLFRAMGSSGEIITLEHHVDVIEELRTIVSK